MCCAGTEIASGNHRTHHRGWRQYLVVDCSVGHWGEHFRGAEVRFSRRVGAACSTSGRVAGAVTVVEEMSVPRAEDTRIIRWQRVVDIPLMVTAVFFLAAYATPIIWPHVDHLVRLGCRWVQWICWACFAVDYVVRLALSQQRGRWFLRHLLDLLVIVFPMSRPLRLLRLVALLHVVHRGATSTLRGRVATYVVGGSSLLSFVAALAVTSAERGHPGANINSFGDAWWWAITTMTTVGYGDRYPVTTQGRFVAVALMISGIALLGTVTATLASWLSDRVRSEANVDREIDINSEILAELRELRTLLEKEYEEGR